MKTIGLLGGMSWESTAHYYRLLNEGVSQRLGGLHSARIVMVSVDFQPLETLMQQGAWATIGGRLTEAARQVEAAGADCLLLCTNTMHKVAPTIERGITIPLLHIADAAALAIKGRNIDQVGLLGTSFTMEENFYRDRLEQRHGLQVIVPSPEERSLVHRVIFDELCRGVIRLESRKAYQAIIERLEEQGACGIIAGCTEISMLITQDESPVPLFDTTELHAGQAIDFALAP